MAWLTTSSASRSPTESVWRRFQSSATALLSSSITLRLPGPSAWKLGLFEPACDELEALVGLDESDAYVAGAC